MSEVPSPDAKPPKTPPLPAHRDYFREYFGESSHPDIKPRQAPTLNGKIIHEYPIVLYPEHGLDPYTLEAVELAVDRLDEIKQKQEKEFRPSGLISFACANANDERLLTEWYGLEKKKNHFYDIRISDSRRYVLRAAGIPYEIDIFKALAHPQEHAHKGNLFFMKGIDFFGEWSPYTDEQQKKYMRLFRKNISYFLEDTALIFLEKDSTVLDNMESQGFTRFPGGRPEIEEEASLKIYLYQRPKSSSPESTSSNNA